MKMFLLRRLSAVLVGTTFALCLPAFGQDGTDMLSKALDLVHQVESPSGIPPTDAQRIGLLTQAIKLAQEAPNHRLKGHRVLAIQSLRVAVAEMQRGDPDHKAAGYLHTADTELGTSVSLAGSTALSAGPMTPSTPTGDDYLKQGQIKMQRYDWHGAVADFDQAINLDPGKANVYLERGAAKLMLGDQRGGIADYAQAIAVDPKNTEAYFKRADALQMKDPKDAIADYQRVIAFNPKDKRAYEGVATVHWLHQEYDETIAAYDQLIAIDPKNWYAYGCRALAKEARRDHDGAIADYGQEILIAPTNFNAFHNGPGRRRKKATLKTQWPISTRRSPSACTTATSIANAPI